PDLLEEQLVREGRLGPPPGGHFPERRACHPPDRADQGERIALARRGAYEISDRLSLFRSYKHHLISRTISTNSSRMSVSPSWARVRTSSLSSGSPPRFLSPASAPARKARRHSSITCGATWISRLICPRSSPRRSRSTISVFRFALQRSGSSPEPFNCRSVNMPPISSGPPLLPQSGVQGNRVLYTAGPWMVPRKSVAA